ncbi:hypothetical protein V9T40_001166 [Parthenolecanium corni]|uniref:Uncharacterized protein n=1 Tax=Parthenolecanium corni TaxID=536013 RepID=A0AAN9TNS8_9HEMI
MIPCAKSSPTLYFSLVVLIATLLWGHRWSAVCAAAATASKMVASVSQTSAMASTEPSVLATENDAAIVGSDKRLIKLMPSDDDLIPEGSKKFVDDFLNSDKFAKQGFKKSHSSKDNDGYAKHDTFHAKDGDSFEYAQNFEFDEKDGDKHGDGSHESSTFDDDDTASSVPKFSQRYFDKKSDHPSKSYHYQGANADHIAGMLMRPDYEETIGSASRRSKRKKELHPSATEYDNYEYADVEEPDDRAPADFEADEGDPEYGALYADADAYDYY